MTALLVVYLVGVALFAAGRVAERDRMRTSVAVVAVAIFAVFWPVMLVVALVGYVYMQAKATS